MSTSRRVVTAIKAGRSVIQSDGPAPTSWCTELWATSGDQPQGFDPPEIKPTLMPPSKGTRWRVVDIPPDSAVRRIAGAAVEGVDEEGWHTTNTVDYVLILDGDITLEVDDGKVELHAGDCVVQRATNHRWRNYGTRPARMVAVMISLE
ncbi:MAG TPA: cupin domain-containing protein [Candidatus Binataceae bacterium]|jgi:mannose-6-phosphate isomerase-like protein (cupin superfamily)|nr:cupin domain-containing protein [Candidatus Binataceae bacterium]